MSTPTIKRWDDGAEYYYEYFMHPSGQRRIVTTQETLVGTRESTIFLATPDWKVQDEEATLHFMTWKDALWYHKQAERKVISRGFKRVEPIKAEVLAL